MNKDDIIKMAREAGLEDGWAGWCQECGCDSDKLTRFAALVAAADRARMCEQFNIPMELAHGKAKGNEAD